MNPSEPILALLVDVPEAARLLTISPRKLWQLTHDGTLRAVRIGRAVRYDRADLQKFIDRQKGGSDGE